MCTFVVQFVVHVPQTFDLSYSLWYSALHVTSTLSQIKWSLSLIVYRPYATEVKWLIC